MEFTGERYIPGIAGDIVLEHMHRYIILSQITTGKDVLDIASGEGYGSHILSKVAKSVVGVDICNEAILSSKQKYKNTNLTYMVGDCAAIPLKSGSVDVVVSFETLEHHNKHSEMLQEIKRVLRPGGVLVISTPDKKNYTDLTGINNPHHVKELYADEFNSLIEKNFRYKNLYGQKIAYGSVIFPTKSPSEIFSYDIANESQKGVPGVLEPVYLITVASDSANIPSLSSGLLEQAIEDTELAKYWDRRHQNDAANKVDQERRINELEELINKKDSVISGLEYRNSKLKDRLNEVENTKTWRVRSRVIKLLSNLKNKFQLILRFYFLIKEVLSKKNIKIIKRKIKNEGIISTGKSGLKILFVTGIHEKKELILISNESLHTINLISNAIKKIISIINPYLSFIQMLSNGVYFYRKKEISIVSERKNLFAKAIFRNRVVFSGWILLNKHAELYMSVNGQMSKIKLAIRSDLESLSKNFGGLRRALQFNLELKKGFNFIEIYLKNGENFISIIRLIFINIFEEALSKKVYKYEYDEVKILKNNIFNQQKLDIKRHLSLDYCWPEFYIFIIDKFNSDKLDITISSINRQIYKKFRLITNNAENILGDNGYLVFIPSGDEIKEDYLYELACVAISEDFPRFIYTDEEVIDEKGLITPFYKPDWSPDYLENYNYIGYSCCFKMGLIGINLDNINIYDLILKYTEDNESIHHIKNILYTSNILNKISNHESDVNALNSRIKRTARLGSARPNPQYPGTYILDIQLRNEPVVSIVIPTAGRLSNIKGISIDLISNVVKSITEKSTYRNYEIIVVDGGELTDSQIKFLDNNGCIRISHNNTRFNFSNSCNLGESKANGEYLIFLNDDIEIVTPDWIQGMLVHFEKPKTGIVGPKLVYPSGDIQHVGVVHNYGCPDHVRDGFEGSESGYFYSTSSDHNYLAVTGACMLIKRSIFKAVSGFSEELSVSFNDIDLCMKINSLGLNVIYASRVMLTHLTSQSRQQDEEDIVSADLSELIFYQKRWAAINSIDPYYNENYLDTARPTFKPEFTSRKI